LHCAFGVGATISPFMLGLIITLFPPKEQSALWSYYILAVICAVISIPLLLLKCPYTPAAQKSGSSSWSLKSYFSFSFSRRKLRYNLQVSLLSIYLLLYVGTETAYGGWIFTYAVNVYHLGESEAAYLSSVFWAAMTVGRLVAVAVSTKVQARSMLIFDMTGALASLVVLLVFSQLKSLVLLWTMTICFGLSMSSVYATVFSLPPQLHLKLSPKATSVLIMGASMGDVSLPMVIGLLMKFFGSNSLIILLLLMLVVASTIFGVAILVVPAVFHDSPEAEFELLPTSDPKDTEEQ